MDGFQTAQIARSQLERERLAKEWLLRLIERTPLPDVGSLPVVWIMDQGSQLIGHVVGALADSEAGTEGDLDEAQRELGAELAGLRAACGTAERIPRDLAVLQTVLIESLRRETPQRGTADFARGVERLAEVFGEMQGTLARSLVEGRDDTTPVDELTGLPGSSQLDEWLEVLLAERRRYGHEFALALVEVDGLERINQAFTPSAGERIVAAVAGVIGGQVRATDQAFRLDTDEFAVLAPHTEVTGLVPMAERIAELIERSQLADGPRIAVATGVVGTSADGETPRQLLEAAVAATYSAKAAGTPVATSPARPPLRLQDP